MKKWIITVIVVGLLGWAVYDFVIKSDDIPEETNPEAGIDKGDTAPDFTLDTLDGETVKLSDYRGQKVLLNFWASWCGPCRAEMPDMQKFYEKYSDDVEILAVNVRETERNDQNVIDFIEEYNATFPVLVDDSSVVSNIFMAHQLPTSYLIDSTGKIHTKAVGAMNYETMVREFYAMD